MGDPASVAAHMKDTTDMFTDIANGTLPSVSYAHPDGVMDGHPSSSKFDLYESYVKNILVKLQANPALAASTAVMVTVDEGGGYYDSGYIQPLDFFGDGTRIPLIIVSPYTTGGNVNHGYADHVSILKFIERNWQLHADHRPQPRQHAQPADHRGQPVRAHELPGPHGPLGRVQLQPVAAVLIPAGAARSTERTAPVVFTLGARMIDSFSKWQRSAGLLFVALALGACSKAVGSVALLPPPRRPPKRPARPRRPRTR